jgi:hypothetical protein
MDFEFYVIKFVGLALVAIAGYKLILMELRGLKRKRRSRR